MSTKLALMSLLMVVAAPLAAHAGKDLNGKDLNGKDLNGKDLNGKDLNGKDLNGVSLTGVTISGTQVTGYAGGVYKSGTGMIGARFNMVDASGNVIGTIKLETAGPLSKAHSDVWAYTVSAEYWVWGCAHYGWAEGVRLDKNCSNVEGAVIARDPYCGTTRWDSLCVNQWWQEYNRIGSANWSYYWHLHQETSACGQDGDQDGFWYSTRPSRKGIFLDGRWDQREGVQGGGAKLKDGRTFACLPSPDRRGGGAIAKCVTAGYKPWKTYFDTSTSTNKSLDKLHQACVRMYRNDYCGDGKSWTTYGLNIDVFDGMHGSFQDQDATQETYSWQVETLWNADGAIGTMVWGRALAVYGQQFHDYKASRSYCTNKATPFALYVPTCFDVNQDKSNCMMNRWDGNAAVNP